VAGRRLIYRGVSWPALVTATASVNKFNGERGPGTFRTQVLCQHSNSIHKLWRVLMKNSRWQGIGWLPSEAQFVIWAPTHFLGWCDEMLYRYCRPYRSRLLRKRLGG
jgi:hypothetical protein